MRLIDASRSRFLQSIVLIAILLPGCRQEAPPPPPPAAGADKPVRLLVVDDPQLAEAIRRVWRAKSEAPLTVEESSAEELAKTGRLGADAVIYPSGMLGELAESGRLMPLSDDLLAAAPLNPREVLDMLRLREVRWGETTYGVSFGSPVLLLAYRPDMLEAAGVAAPSTWAEYQRLASHLADRGNLGDAAPAEPQPWFGVAEPWGPGWAGQTLLARAAAYARHQDQYSDLFDYATMTPLIEGPPFVRALEEMAAAAAAAPPEAIEYSPQDAYGAVLEGRAAMGLAWPSAQVDRETDNGNSDAGEDAGESEASDAAVLWKVLPGSPDVYNFTAERWETRHPDAPQFVPLLAAAGRLGSVTRETSRAQAAMHVLAVLSGEWSREIAPHSRATTLYRESHLSTPGDWLPPSADPQSAESYAEAARESLTHGIWMFSPRIPGRERYLAALDEAVHAALAGETAPAEALAAAAEKWRAITAELGEQEQIDAYQRSLGLEP